LAPWALGSKNTLRVTKKGKKHPIIQKVSQAVSKNAKISATKLNLKV
jgi:hypothetical protein